MGTGSQASHSMDVGAAIKWRIAYIIGKKLHIAICAKSREGKSDGIIIATQWNRRQNERRIAFVIFKVVVSTIAVIINTQSAGVIGRTVVVHGILGNVDTVRAIVPDSFIQVVTKSIARYGYIPVPVAGPKPDTISITASITVGEYVIGDCEIGGTMSGMNDQARPSIFVKSRIGNHDITPHPAIVKLYAILISVLLIQTGDGAIIQG